MDNSSRILSFRLVVANEFIFGARNASLSEHIVLSIGLLLSPLVHSGGEASKSPGGPQRRGFSLRAEGVVEDFR
jgi:hypothetical protein